MIQLLWKNMENGVCDMSDLKYVTTLARIQLKSTLYLEELFFESFLGSKLSCDYLL